MQQNESDHMKHELIMENWRKYVNEQVLSKARSRAAKAASKNLRKGAGSARPKAIDYGNIDTPSTKKQDLKRPGPNASKAEIEKYNQEVYAKYNSKDGKYFCLPKIANEQQQLPSYATNCMKFGKTANGMVIEPTLYPAYYKLSAEEVESLKKVYDYQNTSKVGGIDLADVDAKTLLNLKKRGGVAFFQGLVWRGFGVNNYADLQKQLPGFRNTMSQKDFDDQLRFLRDNQHLPHVKENFPIDENGFIKFRNSLPDNVGHVTSDRISGGASFTTQKNKSVDFAKSGREFFGSKYQVIVRTFADATNNIHVNKTLQKNANIDVGPDRERFGFRKANEGEVIVFGGKNWDSKSVPIDTIYIKLLD